MPQFFECWCSKFDDVFGRTAGVGRQYIGQIGKVDNGVVMVTSHAYDGVKGVPIDAELYKHALSLKH